MTFQDWSEELPRGTESNTVMQSFLEVPDVFSNHLQADANGNKTKANHLKADADGYLKAMKMNEISKEQHSYANLFYLQLEILH